VTGESADSVLDSVAKAAPVLTAADPADWRELARILEEMLPAAPSARAGLETALLDAAGRLANVSAYELLGGRKMAVATDVTIPVVSPDRAAELAAAASRNGFTRFKAKANGAPDDLARVLAVSRSAPNADIKVDANQAFSPTDAVGFVHSVERAGVTLSLLEQPVAAGDIAGLRCVSDNVPVPVYADESAVTPDDVANLVRAQAISGVNVKLMKSGFAGALRIVDMCRDAGLKLMLGCMLESRIGIAAALSLACAIGAFDYFDLDADILIAHQPVSGGFFRNGDRLTVTDLPGLGCQLTSPPTKS